MASAVLGARPVASTSGLEGEIAAAMKAGRGVPGNPIVVELSESEFRKLMIALWTHRLYRERILGSRHDSIRRPHVGFRVL